ncbi:phenylalanine--tRNA ligase subunit beta [Wolbachia endosymbiont of Chironomus riparius]|uniref:phenylalanine--tRNA ligase subunit beta n=1 Tax=Wolbachia endosymbiont of Chironomus riparius TaxID=2883238 RepID=UPI0020A1434B|nr:phenylalanine--tRNA ligase subunit beta [Wolbachia endosymbiont of Chironomus riparius]
MKFTLSWLLDYLETNACLKEITDKLTSIGLEVENVIDNEALAGFIVVEVLEVLPHPNADKLKLCKVYDGSKTLQIVCGASNVENNMKTVLASVGSTLPKSTFTIQPIKMRGVLSEGMLCSTSELALTKESSEGIIKLSDNYQVGEKFFNCDSIIDVNITPNRGDCLNIYGIARDLAATKIGTLKTLTFPEINNEIDSSINVEVADNESFISGRYISNIQNKESPKWLKDKLESIGMRSVSAVVDIANYIMISFGQPMHVYDANKIDKTLTARKVHDKEIFCALNEKEYFLNKNINVISDNNKIHAIAGVIGGKYSECSLETKNIFLESAYFDSVSVMKSSRQLNISTESSYRFARAIDPGFVISGLNLATKMIIDLCGGKVSDVLSAGNLDKKNSCIDFNYQDVNTFGSVSILSDEIFNILIRLGFNIDKKTDSNWRVHVPSWRSDVTISADLVEEVVRIYGYEKIKEEPLISNPEVVTSIHDDVRTLMSSRGFHEVLTWSFMNDITAEKFGYMDKLFTIENPFNNNFNIMRPSIVPNLLQIVAENIAHGVSDLAIFEIGPVYDSETTISQPKYILSGIRSGNNLPRSIYNINREVDVFDVKADFLSVLEVFNVSCDNLTIVEQTDKKYYHPGKSGVFSFKNKILGYFGELHPHIASLFDIEQKVMGFEVILENIKNLPLSKQKFVDYKYQSTRRDFAFIMNKNIKIGNIISILKKSSKLITEVLVFDIYSGSNIESNKVSVGLSITFCSSTHTLTEEEIQKESNMVINSVKDIGGILR